MYPTRVSSAFSDEFSNSSIRCLFSRIFFLSSSWFRCCLSCSWTFESSEWRFATFFRKVSISSKRLRRSNSRARCWSLSMPCSSCSLFSCWMCCSRIFESSSLRSISVFRSVSISSVRLRRSNSRRDMICFWWVSHVRSVSSNSRILREASLVSKVWVDFWSFRFDWPISFLQKCVQNKKYIR